MTRHIAILLISVLPSLRTGATTFVVSRNGGGDFVSIQDAIDYASPTSNDTVLILPGVYDEQVTLMKNITVIGSGYETTIIRGVHNPAVVLKSGSIQWVTISSIGGSGVHLRGGVLRNSVVVDCSQHGIWVPLPDGGGTVVNCVIAGNTGGGVASQAGTTSVVNTIAWANGSWGYFSAGGVIQVSYSNGSRNFTGGCPGCIDVDPGFIGIRDFHLSSTSACWNSGAPSDFDPDFSRSDMGYFGGPACPVFPIVSALQMQIVGGNVQVTVTGKANY